MITLNTVSKSKDVDTNIYNIKSTLHKRFIPTNRNREETLNSLINQKVNLNNQIKIKDENAEDSKVIEYVDMPITELPSLILPNNK